MADRRPDEAEGGLGRAIWAPEVLFSGAHNGLVLHLARLLRPLWKRPFVWLRTNRLYALNADPLLEIQENLILLKEFLSRNSYFSVTPRQDIMPGSQDWELRKKLEEAQNVCIAQHLKLLLSGLTYLLPLGRKAVLYSHSATSDAGD